MKKVQLFIISIQICSICFGQEKRTLQSEDYDLWHRLNDLKVSPDGSAYSYTIFSETVSDTLVVGTFQNLNEIRKIINGYDIHFLPGDKLVYLGENNTVHIEDIKGAKLKSFQGFKRMEKISGGKFILMYSDHLSVSEPGSISLVNTQNLHSINYENVIEVSRSDDEQYLILSQHEGNQNRLIKLSLKDWDEKKLALSEMIMQFISWSGDNKAISYTLHDGKNGKTAIGYLNLQDKHPKPNIINSLNSLSKSFRISTDYLSKPMIFPDKNLLFFWIQKPAKDSLKKNVEIWKSKDLYSYPVKDHFPPYKPGRKLAVYNLRTNTINKITAEKEQQSFISPTGRYVLSLSNGRYLPDFVHKGGFSDIRIIDVFKNVSYSLLEKYPDNYKLTLQFSPSGNSVIYFSDSKWWHFDLASKKAVALESPEMQFFDYYKSPDLKRMYDNVIWSTDEEYIITSDEDDVWMLKTDGSSNKKLTNGQANNIVFRLAINSYRENSLHFPFTVNLKEGIYFEAQNLDTGEQGYYVWKQKKGLRKIAYGPYRYSQLNTIPGKNQFLFLRENFSTSPELVYHDTGNIQIIAKSNMQQSNYSWGNSKMVHYRSLHNQPLKAALFYPANYKEGKKYPLVMNIYEDTSVLLHKYVNPNEVNLGVNTSILTLNGYFVLQPQITYGRANPGGSAHEAVDAALNFLEDTGKIDMDHVGLIGHSFGGYEASYIATQSNRFAAIVAGSPFTDLVSSYFTYNEIVSGPEFFRTELRQSMMSKDFFSSKERYLANSPLHQADHVGTPILLYHGKEDSNVSWLQSREFFFAMMRLGKESILLAYPGENHASYSKENNQDLRDRLLDWYGYYLKGEPKAQWMQ